MQSNQVNAFTTTTTTTQNTIHLQCTIHCEIILFILRIRQCPLLVGSWHTTHHITLRAALRIACVLVFRFIFYVTSNEDDDVFMLRCLYARESAWHVCVCACVCVLVKEIVRERNRDSVGVFFYIHITMYKICSKIRKKNEINLQCSLFAYIYCHISSYRCHHHFLIVSVLLKYIFEQHRSHHTLYHRILMQSPTNSIQRPAYLLAFKQFMYNLFM